MDKKPVTYHIIGAGIAGLACAKFIKQKNPHIRTVVYEASDKPGGRCYSFDDKDFGTRLDNATHVIIGANKNMAGYINRGEWETECCFWDAHSENMSRNHKDFSDLIIKSMTNTLPQQTAPAILKKILWKTFPWGKKQRQVYFSKNDLSQRLINLFTAYADEIHYNYRLLKIDSQFGRAAQLNFVGQIVDIGAEDRVIVAVDNRSYARLFNQEALPHNGIINIFYRTSQKIYLPDNINFVGVSRGLCDWIFANENILGVTISAVSQTDSDLQELARNIWLEVCRMRGVGAAFVPSFKVFHHKTATICQDTATNNRRPLSAATDFPNVFIAGDWTMKDYPCCLEAAVLSAERALKAAMKAQ